jgi:hypothetical protein
MKLIQALAVLAGTALFFVTEARSGPEVREWTLKPSDKPDHVQFQMELRSGTNRWINGSPVPWTQFKGITKDQIGKLTAPAKFEFVRDSGKLLCEGTFHLGRGLGTFAFQSNPGYRAELEKIGFRLVGNKQELEYFMADVSLDFARAVRDANLKASNEELLEMRIHGLSKEYIGEMRASGYTDLRARDYIDFKIHGVQPQFVRDIKAAGYKVSADKIVELRIHGVDTQFMADLKKAGYDLPMDRIMEMKIHGVSREYIQALGAYGLKPRAEDILQMRIHGVSAEYLKGLREAGFQNLNAERIVEMKIHGVSAEFVKKAYELGYRFKPEEITEMRIHGVDAAYLRKLKDAGFQNLTAQKIVQLRIHGVD